MMAAGSRVAIVGAGVGGLAAALYLHRQGHEVTVIERFSEARPVGSGLLLQPVGLAVLDDLGLLETICRLGKRVDHLRGNDCDSGRLVLDVGYRQGQFAIGIHRAALFQTLRDAVAAAGIAVLTSLEVSGTRRTGPQIELLDPAGKPLASPFTCVIDAAGAHSPLSAAVRRSKPLSYGAFWATVNWPAAAGFDSSALQQRYKWASVMIGVLPVGRQTLGSPEQAAFFWSLKRDDVAGVVATGIDLWKDRVLGLWPDTAPLLDQIAGFDDLTFAAYGHHTLAEPFSDGLFHIGDSGARDVTATRTGREHGAARCPRACPRVVNHRQPRRCRSGLCPHAPAATSGSIRRCRATSHLSISPTARLSRSPATRWSRPSPAFRPCPPCSRHWSPAH
jgi:2-polyprenyl-6-methoxyphenol hydroxylase-like FAD-dependent oxidoreductase